MRWLILMGLLLLAPGFAGAVSYEYQLDRVELTVPGASYDESYDFTGSGLPPGGIGYWLNTFGTALVEDGVVRLKDPGTPFELATEDWSLQFERSDVQYEFAPYGSTSGGLTSPHALRSTWAPDVPPVDDWYGLGALTQVVQGKSLSIGLLVANSDPAVAALIPGTQPGLAMVFLAIEEDHTGGSPAVWLGAESVAFAPGDVTGDVVLEMSFDGAAYHAAYSLDGGATFSTPFGSIAGAAPLAYTFAADPIVGYAPEPGVPGLLIGAAAIAGRRRRRSRRTPR